MVSLLSIGLMGATVGMQVFSLTGSSLHVGLVSAVLAGPMIAGLIVGGVLADRLDRRSMMVSTRGIYTLVVIGFLANAAAAPPRLWPIYMLAFFAGAMIVPLLLSRLRALPAAPKAGAPGAPPASGLHALAEGMPFVRSSPLIIGLRLIRDVRRLRRHQPVDVVGPRPTPRRRRRARPLRHEA